MIVIVKNYTSKFESGNAIQQYNYNVSKKSYKEILSNEESNNINAVIFDGVIGFR